MSSAQYKKPKIDGWYIAKHYPHLDAPVSYNTAAKFALNPSIVARHDFLPFMGYSKQVRRYKGKEKGASIKARPIKYASHLDGCIYCYYAYKINQMYEQYIRDNGLGDFVIGYRAGRGSNIHLAREAVKEIKSRNSCAAIALDINDFYGSIDHKNLEAQWCSVLGVTKLPKDHLQVFLSLTKWACVDRDKLITYLGLDADELPLRLIDDIRVLHKIRKEDKLREVNDRIMSTNKNDHGIPQGSPMSALLSNVYMLPFDMAMKQLAQTTGGFYRRYSDDILFICETEQKEKVLDFIDGALAERGKSLSRNKDKDHISSFRVKPGSNKLTCDKEFQYLGFTFDGQQVRMRSQTLAKYHRRLKLSAKQALATAKRKRGRKPLKVHRKKLNRMFTHLGYEGFVGGYARMSQKIMGGNAISKQVKGSYERLTKELTKSQKKKESGAA